MILSRYLLREVLATWLAITFVLLAILIASRFASALNFAAKGAIPKDLLLSIVGLSSLRYLVILMPVSLLLAILRSLGRMYSENEMAAMAGCGVGPLRIYRPVMLFAVLVAILTAILALQVGPWAGRQADYLLRNSQRLLRSGPFDPGQFKLLPNDRAVFYTSKLSADGTQLGDVFAQTEARDGVTDTVVARSGDQHLDAATGVRQITLHDGYRYLGQAGHAGYDVVRFKQLQMRILPSPLVSPAVSHQFKTTSALLAAHDPVDQAELQARMALPLSVLILALLAIPLSHLRPRQGHYSKIVLGMIIYLLYANLVSVAQKWIGKGELSPDLGLWWIHAIVLAGALGLIAVRGGWLRRRHLRPLIATAA
ncbi:MAG TPA: LPS export ABC transporter permease LptF [Nevskiaceae bacterium]